MKVGDTVPVNIGGHVVAQARVAELGDGKATLVVPGTVVVMAVRTELDRAPVDTSGTETIVTGVDRQEASTGAAEQTVSSESGVVNGGPAEVVNATTPEEAAPSSVSEAPSEVVSSETVPVRETDASE